MKIVTLQNKLIIFTTAIIVSISTVFGIYFITYQKASLEKGLKDRGFTIANSIAYNSQFSVLAEDKSNLKNFIDSALKEKDIISVAVVDKNGRFLAHSDNQLIDKKVSVASDEAAFSAKEELAQTNDVHRYTISVPIFSMMASSDSEKDVDLQSIIGLGGSSEQSSKNKNAKREIIGSVIIAMSTNTVIRESEQIKINILIFTLIIAISGVIVIVIFSHNMLGPLRQVILKLQKICQGEVEAPVQVKSMDEIGDLSIAFNNMVKYVSDTAENARLISQGVLDREVKPLSDKDVLGNSFKVMVEYLQETASLLQKVAQGDLKVVVKPKSENDVLGNALNDMLKGLRDLISKIQESGNNIHSRANEMASLSSASNEAISQMASNVSQISLSISKISNTTQTVASVAQKTAKLAEKGDETIKAITDKVSRSRGSATQSVELIKNLGRCSMQIGEIINYITKVADQTNLLSLNAAIEAARAGEAGLGFAVVADEVRKLAEGSAQSASKISGLIHEVQLETNKVVTAVEAVAQEVGESANVTEDAGRNFRDISRAAKDIAEQIETLAASFEETAANAEEASASSQEQVATFEEISSSIDTLKEIAEKLKDSTAKFKIANEK
jgi:methyl-accepting chemotaxis protein